MKFHINERARNRQQEARRLRSKSLGFFQTGSKRLFHPLRNLLITAALLLSAQVQAQVLSLDTVLELIDERNPMLEEYEEKIRALNEYAKGANSWMAPMVGAGTFMTPYQNQGMMEEGNKGAWMFSAEQEIPNPAKLRARRNYMESQADVEAERRAVQYNDLRTEAKRSYYQWLVDEERLNVLSENERIMELMLKLAQIRYPYNQGSLGNVYKAEGRLSEVRSMMVMTQADIEAMSIRLKALMNLPLTDSIMIDTTTVVKFSPQEMSYDTASLREQRSDLRQITETIEVMRLNQQLQRYQTKPDFKITFNHMQPVANMPAQFTAMAMISIPIAPWSSRMYRAEIKGMEYDIAAMKKNQAAVLVETQGMLASMGVQLRGMKQQLENYETKIIPALHKNYQTLMLAYEENTEQLPIVIDGWEALNMAQMEYLNRLEEYYMMIVTYEKALEK